MTKKKLLVTADDFGLTNGINNGIIDAFKKGIVTRASLMANGEAFEHAVSLAKRNLDLKVGVHLTLIEEIPLNLPHRIKSLMDSDRTMIKNYKEFLARYLLHKINFDEVYMELESQIKKVLNADIKINHMDSHQHLHMFPPIFKITLELAKKYQIKKIRLFKHDINSIRCLKELTLNLLAKLNTRNSVNGTFDSSDIFWGLKVSGNLTEIALLSFLDKIKYGSTELMCHPGYSDNDFNSKYAHWGYNPEEDLKAVLSERVIEKIKNTNIQLIS